MHMDVWELGGVDISQVAGAIFGLGTDIATTHAITVHYAYYIQQHQ